MRCHFVVGGAWVPGTREAGPCHSMPMHVNQSDAAAGRATLTCLTLPSTGAAGTRCRWYGCASVAGGCGDDHHTAAARVRAAPRAACSGAHACKGRTTNTELGGRALRQPTKKPAARAFRWAGGGSSSEFLARHGCAPIDTVELAPLVKLNLDVVDVPPLRLRDWLQVLRLHVAMLV